MIRITMAAPLPQKIAAFCCLGGRDLAARAITTALSPDSTMFTPMMAISPPQNCADISSSMLAFLRSRPGVLPNPSMVAQSRRPPRGGTARTPIIAARIGDGDRLGVDLLQDSAAGAGPGGRGMDGLRFR